MEPCTVFVTFPAQMVVTLWVPTSLSGTDHCRSAFPVPLLFPTSTFFSSPAPSTFPPLTLSFVHQKCLLTLLLTFSFWVTSGAASSYAVPSFPTHICCSQHHSRAWPSLTLLSLFPLSSSKASQNLPASTVLS